MQIKWAKDDSWLWSYRPKTKNIMNRTFLVKSNLNNFLNGNCENLPSKLYVHRKPLLWSEVTDLETRKLFTWSHSSAWKNSLGSAVQSKLTDKGSFHLHPANSSSLTFWSSQFASSSRSNWTSIWTSNSNGNGTWTYKQSSHLSTAKEMSVKATFFFHIKTTACIFEVMLMLKSFWTSQLQMMNGLELEPLF